MTETVHFVNEGFGWDCKHCRESEGAAALPPETRQSLARFFREGESEGGAPRLSSNALARWKDETRNVLRCARCGVEEDTRRAV
ncbi:MAG: hypothetical protein QOJ70_3643 [Acidobacteriota bacterium]|nr:hypothetical protein [Acidobacteriota bacterium]